MHYVIMDERTNWFVTEEATYTTQVEEAATFPSVAAVQQFCRANYLLHCGIYARFPDGSLIDSALVNNPEVASC